MKFTILKLVFAISLFFIFDCFSQINQKTKKQSLEVKSNKIKVSKSKRTKNKVDNKIIIHRNNANKTLNVNKYRPKKVKHVHPNQLKSDFTIIRKNVRRTNLYLKPEYYIKKAYPKRYTYKLRVCATYEVINKSPAKLHKFNPKTVKRKYTLWTSRNNHKSYYHYLKMKYNNSYKKNKRYRKWLITKQIIPRKINMPIYLKESDRSKPNYDSKEANIWYE